MPFKFSPGHCGPDCDCGGFGCTPKEGSDILWQTCSPCDIPCIGITLSWTNTLTGSGSVTLTQVGPATWESACVNQIIFRFGCVGGEIVFSATYYTGGTCPTGASVTCSSVDGTLTRSSYACDPLVVVYAPANPGCNTLIVRGYTRFTLTQ